MDPEALADLARVPHGSSDDPDLLDFSANCNPRTPEGVVDAYADALDAVGAYPDDGYPEFRSAAADHVGCAPGSVVPTPGGLAAIRLAMAALVAPGESVLVPRPSFGEYAREARLQGAEVERVPHDSILDCDPAEHAMVVVCNPNNPTGDACPDAALRDYAERCRAAGTVLLVDEAFLGFTDRPSLAGTAGVAVARSLTKLFGTPGLRAGFAVATGETGDRLATARRTWNLGVPAARVGTHCLRRREFVARTRERVATERARLVERLDGPFDVVRPTDATERADVPFVLLAADSNGAVDALLERAREAGLALRDARTFAGLDAHVRVAVRLPDENDRLCEVLVDG